MKRLLLLACLVTMAFSAVAESTLQNRPTPLFNSDKTAIVENTADEEFLPVEKAFRLEKRETNSSDIKLTFIVADGYYLYKNRFAFTSDNPKVIITAPTLPQGEQKNDEFLGDVEVYHNILEITVPVTNPEDLAFNLEVKYQGCAEKGLCYPMETVNIPIAGILPIPQATTDGPAKTLSFSESMAALSWSQLFYYFLIGLGLAFTPCVFPMLPILSGIVLRGQAGNLRAQLLALTYILAMAITYALLGVLMGLFGAELNLQARLQSPWVLIPFTLFFLLFALAMFGLFELRLPAFITNPLNKTADKTHGGSLIGAAILGICSSLVVSPCVTAPFAGILLHISSTGDAIGGGISLFVLGLGMGVPLFIIAAGGGALLPKAGHWMIVVRNGFGVMLLGVAILLIARILPGYIELMLWGLLAAGVAIFMGTFEFSPKTKIQRLSQLAGLFLVVYAVCAWLGAWQGHTNPLQPLKTNTVSLPQTAVGDTVWQVVTTKDGLNEALATAKVNNKIAIVDWSADWCRACLEMEHNVFQTPEVAAKLAAFQLIRIDISETTEEQRALLNTYRLIGPPAILFFDKTGNELVNARIIGEMGKEAFIKHLTALTP